MSVSKYEDFYSEDSFWDKIVKFAKKAGAKVIYSALLLYYVMQKPDLPLGIRATIIGALGYFISPFDAIPDIAPLIGFTDDFGVLVIALSVAAIYIDQEVKDKAKIKLQDWFGKDVLGDIAEVDEKIG